MQEMILEINDHVTKPWQKASWWYRTTSLKERTILKQKTSDSNSSHTLHNSDRAKQRLQRWKEQFDNEDYFSRRLAMDFLTEDDLLTLLDEPIEAIQVGNFPPPPWFIELLTAFTNEDATDSPKSHSTMGQDTQAMAFLNTLAPLLRRKVAHLQARIHELTLRDTTLPFDPQTVVSLLIAHIPTLIFPKLIKTIVLEMHVARVQGYLEGETPEERFQSFLQQLSQPEKMLSFLEEYTVLARQLVELLDRWVTCELAILERLCADWEQIQSVFLPDGDPGVLIEIQQEAGDTHRGGQNVTILTWSSGFRLVYKPRSMALDIHFQELLTWLNEHGQQPAFRTITLLDKQAYG